MGTMEVSAAQNSSWRMITQQTLDLVAGRSLQTCLHNVNGGMGAVDSFSG